MRKIELTTGLVLAAALAACGKPTPGRSANGAATNVSANASGPAATAAATAPASSGSAGGVALNPGQWETVTETAMTGLPAGMPPAVAEKMKNQKMTSRHCLTPEKAAHPGSDFFGKASKQCANNIVMAGGRVSGDMTCKDPHGGNSVIAIDGQYGGDSMDMAMKMTMNGQGQSMAITSHMVGHRIGECPAGAKDD